METTFEDWCGEQDIEYSLIVSVNGYPVYSSHYSDMDDLYGDARKAESAVAEELESQFEDEHGEV